MSDPRLASVIGFLELGLFEEASEELEAFSPEMKASREALSLRVAIHSQAKEWDSMREAAAHLVKFWPDDAGNWISLGFATRRCQSIFDAEKVLHAALSIHPSEALIHYNLACYAAQTGRIGEAKERLSRAISIDGSLKALAMVDPDLEPLRCVPDFDGF